MKNKHIESAIARAKIYAKSWRNGDLSPRGNFVPHCYESNNRTYAWWDDVSFKLGSQVVSVWWVHPRMEYKDKCHDLAYDAVVDQHPRRSADDMFANTTPIYKKIGKNKNRKRVIGYQAGANWCGDSMRDWFNIWRDKEKELLTTSDQIITPHLQVTQHAWGRGVSICAPIEIVDQPSLEDMADLVRQILRGETSVGELWPEYTYTRENWIQEAHDE